MHSIFWSGEPPVGVESHRKNRNNSQFEQPKPSYYTVRLQSSLATFETCFGLRYCLPRVAHRMLIASFGGQGASILWINKGINFKGWRLMPPAPLYFRLGDFHQKIMKVYPQILTKMIYFMIFWQYLRIIALKI